MAERIDNITPLRGRPPLYPWDEWLDGSAWRITQGEDFDVTAETMAQMVRLRASKAGLSATARVRDNTVEFQALKEAA